MKLRVLIAEDEPISREHLRRLLQLEAGVEIVAECASGRDAVLAVEQTQPDVMLLDVKLPDLDGFEVVQRIAEERRPAIIFVTGSELHAIRAFDTEAADYLLKPFDRGRLSVALDRARRRLGNPESLVPAAEPESDKELEKLLIKSPGRIAIIKTAEVDWLCAADNYVEVHAAKNRYLMRTTVGGLLARLPQNKFARISRSVLVNIDRVKEIRTQTHGDYLVILNNGTELRGSRKYRADLAGILSGEEKAKPKS